MSRIAFVGVMLAWLGVSPGAAQERLAPYVSTPQDVVERMLDLARVSSADVVYDLGSGDGRTVITAAKKYGARGFGVDLDRKLVALANQNARKAGVADRAVFYQRDLHDTDVSPASVMSIYLLPEVNLMIRGRLLATLQPGTRIVSHDYGMGDWAPDERAKLEYRDAYLWIVPAKVDGTWAFKENSDGLEGTVTLTQRYQRIGGTVTIGGKSQQLLSPTLASDKLTFAFIDAGDQLRTAMVTVEGNAFKGELHGVGFAQSVSGRKL